MSLNAYSYHVVGPMKILDGPTIIQQIEGQMLDLGHSKIVKSTSGQVFATFTGLMSRTPKFSGRSTNLAVFLGAVGSKGLMLVTGLELYNQLEDTTTGLRKSGANHEKFAFGANALVIPRQIVARQGQEAMITFDVIGTNASGLTDPVTFTQAVALPASSGISELFTLGPVEINGTNQQAGIMEVTIDFGLTEVIKRAGGAVYAQLIGIKDIIPKISIRADDASVIANLTMLGTAQSANPTVSTIYLRKMSNNGVRVADATAQHISFQINSGLWLPREKGGSHPNELETPFEIACTWDGTRDPLVISTATAIS